MLITKMLIFSAKLVINVRKHKTFKLHFLGKEKGLFKIHKVS